MIGWGELAEILTDGGPWLDFLRINIFPVHLLLILFILPQLLYYGLLAG